MNYVFFIIVVMVVFRLYYEHIRKRPAIFVQKPLMYQGLLQNGG